jgi:hypothetical protein
VAVPVISGPPPQPGPPPGRQGWAAGRVLVGPTEPLEAQGSLTVFTEACSRSERALHGTPDRVGFTPTVAFRDQDAPSPHHGSDTLSASV